MGRLAVLFIALLIATPVAAQPVTWTQSVLSSPGATTPLSGGEIVPIIQGGRTHRVTVTDLIAFVPNVSSIYGRTGAVTAQAGDYALSQITATITAPLVRSTNALSLSIGAGLTTSAGALTIAPTAPLTLTGGNLALALGPGLTTASNALTISAGGVTSAMINSLVWASPAAIGTGVPAAGTFTVLGATDGSSTQTNVGQSLFVTTAGPANWASFGYVYDAVRVSVGGFPVSAEFGYGAPGAASVQAIVGAVDAPTTAVGANTGGAGVAGYCRTASGLNGFNCSGVYGQAGATANNSQILAAYGGLVTNAPAQQSLDGAGYSVPGGMQGMELDIRFLHGAGGITPPNTNVYGYRVTGDSFADPSANGGQFLAAFMAETPSIITTPHLKWAVDFWCTDGSSAQCLNIGRMNSTGSNNQGQQLFFSSTTAGGLMQTGYAQMVPDGSLVLSFPLGLQIGAPIGGGQGSGTLNLPGNIYINGVGPTGVAGGYVRSVSPTFTGSVQMDGLTAINDVINEANFAVGTTAVLGAVRAYIKGAGATNATLGLLVRDSGGVNTGLGVYDGGQVSVTFGSTQNFVLGSTFYRSCSSTPVDVNGYLGCTVSARWLKEPTGRLALAPAADALATLRPALFSYRDPAYGRGPQVGFYADEVCAMDERLCVRDAEGRAANYLDRGLLAYLVAAVKEQRAEIERLRNR